MYRCEVCDEPVSAGIRCHKVVVKKMLMDHPHRQKVFRKFDEETGRWYYEDDPGGRGWQIVKELKMCPSCAQQFESGTLQVD